MWSGSPTHRWLPLLGEDWECVHIVSSTNSRLPLPTYYMRRTGLSFTYNKTHGVGENLVFSHQILFVVCAILPPPQPPHPLSRGGGTPIHHQAHSKNYLIRYSAGLLTSRTLNRRYRWIERRFPKVESMPTLASFPVFRVVWLCAGPILRVFVCGHLPPHCPGHMRCLVPQLVNWPFVSVMGNVRKGRSRLPCSR
jgi:hypothetical protein